MVARTHLPLLIRTLLMVLPLICSLLVGLSAAADPKRSWTHILTFALTMSFTVFVILDLDYPRAGLIRIDHFDLVLATANPATALTAAIFRTLRLPASSAQP